MTRPQPPLDDAGQRALEALVRKKKLTPYERGQLQALSRRAAPHDRERAEARLVRSRGADSRQPAIPQSTIDKWVKAIDAALDAEDDRR